jgi:hypothetical protein
MVSIELNAMAGRVAYLIDENDSWNNLGHALVNIALNDLIDFSS